MSDGYPVGSTGAASPIPADESPTTGAHRVGPMFEPTHPLAVAPVTSPPHSVDGFVREFLRELNTGQGVALAQSTINDQYLALARTVRHYLMARWLETMRHNRMSGSKFVGYLSAEYLLGRQLGNALMATDLNDVAEKALASCGLDLADPARPGGRARPGQRRPGSAGGVLHRLAGHHERAVHRLRHPLRVRHLPPDLRRRPAGRAARHLAGPGRPVGVPAPGGRRSRRLRRLHRDLRRQRHRAHPLGAGMERAGHPVQLHGPGLPERPGEHTAAVERAGHQGLRPGHLQRRGLRRGGPGPDLRREHHQGALPRGLHPAGQGAAPAAAVLLRRVLDPRLPRPRPRSGLRPARPARADHLPAQRHPPGDRGARADAGPGRREGIRVGRGVGDHPEVLRLHLPHAAARGAGDLVDRAAGTAAAAAPGDHLPDQRRLPRRGARGLPRRRAAGPAHVDHRRLPRPVGADGLPGHRRRHQGQRRGRPALPAAGRQGAAGLLQLLAGRSSPTSPTASRRGGSCGWPTRGCRA